MCRLAAWASRVPTTLQQVLGPDGLARLSRLSTIHSHGWGAAWRDADGALQLHRSPSAAHEDPGFPRFATEVAATAAVVHLRLGTPGYGSGVANVHPFRDGDWAFAHNGAILPATGIGRLLRSDSRRSPGSQTDSERYFLALRDELDALPRSARAGADDAPLSPDPGTSVAGAMDRMLDRMTEVGLSSASLNAMLLEPSALRVISCHDPEASLGSIRVWPAADPQDDVAWPPYFPLRYTESPELCAAVSSGIVQPGPAGPWRILPNDVVWTVRLTDLSSATAAITRRADPSGQSLRRSA